MNACRIVMVAVGGQGNLLACRVVGEAALGANIPVHMSEIHGMAQRGGVVEAAVVLGDAESFIVSDGDADVLIGFEPLETIRAMNKCNKDTVVITNTRPLPPVNVSIGKGVYPDVQAALDQIQGMVKKLVALDATEMAQEAGTTMSANMVLLGALARTGVISLSDEMIKNTITRITKKDFHDVNMKAFDLGYHYAGTQ
ncbi:MAG: indolepyruvate oxidoreductase subunit beta [Thermodesulfobacteriota bacterium]|nr:indolepyruvate oxidoreductase subunit beta [Thermodesulfobacteriota bacterium]